VDKKCNSPGCWYCSQRCSNCLTPTEFKKNAGDLNQVTYCSENCRNILFGTPLNTHVVLCMPGESSPENFQQRCVPLEDAHIEFFHVYVSGLSPNGLAYQSEFCICSGRQSGDMKFSSNLYVVHYSRNMEQQLLIEFFIDEDLKPLSCMPYVNDDSTIQAIIKSLREDGAIEEALKIAYQNLSFEEKNLIATERNLLHAAAS